MLVLTRGCGERILVPRYGINELATEPPPAKR